MANMAAAQDQVSLAAEEAHLAGAAAAGDADAFAALYVRYEQRLFNLAYRITGSEALAADAVRDAFLSAMGTARSAGDDFAVGSYLFAATRGACHEMVRGGQRTRSADPIAAPAAMAGPDVAGPGRPEANGEHALGLAAQQEEVRTASMHLPERQREVLALCALEGFSYEEIARIMETKPATVAQLVSRARINLRDELRGTALASIAAPSPECERALPLIAMREDGQLESASREAAWLDSHIGDCERCRSAVEATEEADASYRGWLPIAAPAWLIGETMAKAAALADADWSEATAKAAAARDPTEPLPGMPPAYLPGGARRSNALRRRNLRLAAGLAALLVLAGLGVVFAAGDPPAPPAGHAAGAAAKAKAAATKHEAGKRRGRAKRAAKARRATGAATQAAAATTVEPTPVLESSPAAGSAPDNSGGSPEKATIQPSAPKSSPKQPSTVPAPSSQPVAAPAPIVETPPVEESHPGHEPPGQAKKEHPPKK
jgi:RNA polymerase sigma factor (sigma-70 family)